MRPIDADALKKKNERLLHCDFPYLSEITLEELIDEAPTVEMLTTDEMQVIRIHMGAIKERLCNQKRWSEAVDYQIICDKLDKMLEMGEDD